MPVCFWIIGSSYGGKAVNTGFDYRYRTCVYMPVLTTEYVYENGLYGDNSGTVYSYGKISGDGKTYYWYTERGTTEQFNGSGARYIWLAIG